MPENDTRKGDKIKQQVEVARDSGIDKLRLVLVALFGVLVWLGLALGLLTWQGAVVFVVALLVVGLTARLITKYKRLKGVLLVVLGAIVATLIILAVISGPRPMRLAGLILVSVVYFTALTIVALLAAHNVGISVRDDRIKQLIHEKAAIGLLSDQNAQRVHSLQQENTRLRNNPGSSNGNNGLVATNQALRGDIVQLKAQLHYYQTCAGVPADERIS